MLTVIFLQVAVLCVKLVEGFPTRQSAGQVSVTLSPCPTPSGNSHSIVRQMLGLNSLTRRAREKTAHLLAKIMESRFDDETDRRNALSSHWPFVNKLEPNLRSVEVALREGDEFAMPILHSDLVLYQLYMERIETDERTWANFRGAVARTRHPTFENFARDLHNIHVNDLVCQLRHIMTSLGLSPEESSPVSATVVQNSRDERLSDSRAVVILNSFYSDYLSFLTLYTEKYVCTVARDLCRDDVTCTEFCGYRPKFVAKVV